MDALDENYDERTGEEILRKMSEESTIDGYCLRTLEQNKKNPYAHILRQILKEKRDTEQFLRMVAPQYLGVYILDKETDFFRDIVGPDYFRKIVKEKNGYYSEALKIYGKQFVIREDQQVIEQVLDYDRLYDSLWSGQKVNLSYRKTDGTLVNLLIGRYSDQEEEKNLSLWIYADEGIEYKKQLGMDNNAANILHSAVTSGLWCIEYDEKGTLKECIWSNSFRKILGYESVVELPNTWKAWIDKIHPDDQQYVDQEYEKVQNDYSGKTNYDIEYRMCDRQGEYHWFRDTAHFSRRADGTPICANGLVMLMDEKHEMDAKLREALQKEQKQRKMMEALSVDYTAVFECDLINDTISVIKMKESSHSFHNREHMSSFSEWIQYTYEHVVIQNSAPDFLNEFDSRHLMEYFVQHDSLITRHRTIPDSDGIEYFEMRVIPVCREEAAYKVMLAYRPIDDIVKSEKKQQEQLSLALAAAEQSSRAKTTFLNSMSHDIRTPMNAIIGFTALAQTHIDNVELVQDYLSKISTSSTHLLSLINDILDMSRIESGSVKLDEKPVHMPDLLHDLRSMIQGLVNARQQNLYIDTQDVQNEDIIIDKLRLNQILLNIISNAIKFTPVGGDIIIRLLEKPCSRKEYTTYEFYIKDTGIGMSEQFVGHVFDTFARERSSTVSGIQGTGLGMAITKNIVEMMGGKITAESQEGKGSLFTVTLNVKLADHPVKYEPIPELKGARALVIDDDINTCRSVCKMLRNIDMRPDWTASGKEAVLRAQDATELQDEYKVYIVDYLMPDMNGIETVRRIRRVISEDVPIIVLTAYDWSDYEQEAREAGVTAFVGKPIFMSELREVLTHPVDNASKSSAKTETKKYDYSGKHILLVEDNELNREIAVAILEETGMTIDCAEDGIEAMNIINEAPEDRYDLILMDIQMPRMDGYTATREIRTLPNNRKANIPIVAMTANAFDEDRKKAFETGMNGHIVKPVDMNIIARTLDGIFGNKSLGD